LEESGEETGNREKQAFDFLQQKKLIIPPTSRIEGHNT
jgi:hypothetical protein